MLKIKKLITFINKEQVTNRFYSVFFMQIEDSIQAEIVMYYRNYYQRLYKDCLIFSIPNGGKRDKRTAMLMKSTGLLSGAADLVVIYFGTLVFVELKTETGIQSEEQKVFAQRVRDCGYSYYLLRSLLEFKHMLSLI